MKHDTKPAPTSGASQAGQPPAFPLAEGSASDIFAAELSGKLIRPLRRNRMLQTGERLCNRFGQELWMLESFGPQGARVSQWPYGGAQDIPWESLYAFFERVPDDDPALPNS